MKILWISCRLLHPLIGGDRIRTYKMLQALCKQHEITYLCLQTPVDSPEVIEQASEYSDLLIPIPHRDHRRRTLFDWLRLSLEAVFSRIPLIATKYRSPEMRRAILTESKEKNYDLIVCDYLAPLVNFYGIHKEIETPILLFHHNIESLIWDRHTKNASNPLKKWLYYLQWKRTHHYEEVGNAITDGHIAVSEDEYLYFKDERNFDRVLGAVPTGVDFDEFRPEYEKQEPSTVAFLGAMDWHANVDAVIFFAKEILPEIRKVRPETRFLVIGRNPGEQIRKLGKEDPLIEVTGTVNEVTPWLRRAAVMVLPLRVGGGTRIKVYEAVAAGIPVVSTSVGVEGLDLDSPEHYLQAENASQFCHATVQLLENPIESREMANCARNHILSHYSWSNVASVFTSLSEKAIEVSNR